VGERSGRLAVLRVLVFSMLITLVARLYFVQVLDSDKPTQSANDRYDASIVVPAMRGQIVDAQGQVLVGNRVTQMVTVDRATVEAQPDGGAAVLQSLGALLGRTAAQLRNEITPCGVSVPAPCWTGQPYQPVPVQTDASGATVLAISERSEQYPGVAIAPRSVRTYPNGSLAAQEMGYIANVREQDVKANPKLDDADTIGVSGLEQQYDTALRGVNGAQDVRLDALGNVREYGPLTAAESGDTLVTSIDGGVQKLAEQALASQIAASRAKGNAAPSGSVVVMDPQTGRVLALASYPTFDLSMFSGGISNADYASLTGEDSGDPLLSRAVAGQYAPGSTFKLVSASSDVTHGFASLDGAYPCPGSLNVGGQVKTNFDSEAYPGALSLQKALAVSCDTWFYAFAAKEWSADEARVDAGQAPDEYLQAMAKSFGFGTAPGVDLPADEQASGSLAGRASRQESWDQNKDQYCADATAGYPNEKDAVRRQYLTKLAGENCTDGWRYRMPDNADLAIGQGETTVSPLQLAVAYSALVNGGTIWQPTIGWAEVDSAGKVVKTINPVAKGKVPVSQEILDYIANSLHFQSGHEVSGALAFDGSPIKTMIGGKTGTAEVYGKQDTSLFASWAPADPSTPAKFVVVGIVDQAGTGSSAAAPMVRKIYEGIYGVGQAPVLAGSAPASTLPVIAAQPGSTSTPASGAAPAPAAPAGGGAATVPTPTPSTTSRRRRRRCRSSPSRRRP
jgi:penicillin-binding protein 2